MSKASKSSTSCNQTAEAASPADPLGPAALLRWEDPGAYDILLAQLTAAVAPADMLEAVFVRDIADLSWEVLHLRRHKAQLLNVVSHKGVRALLSTHFPALE
jgi:hypothetical protein